MHTFQRTVLCFLFLKKNCIHLRMYFIIYYISLTINLYVFIMLNYYNVDYPTVNS